MNKTIIAVIIFLCAIALIFVAQLFNIPSLNSKTNSCDLSDKELSEHIFSLSEVYTPQQKNEILRDIRSKEKC